VRISPTALYTYADVVVGNELRFEEGSFDTTLNPPVLGVKSEESRIDHTP
jgi:hypothetical protein